MLFADRKDAGRQLATRLIAYKSKQETLVLGLARGGMVVAAEVARELGLPLNVIVVRKVGAPMNEELALGAVAECGEGVFNEHLIALLGVSAGYLKQEVSKQKQLLRARLALYRGACPAPAIQGKTVIVIDDGIATGASMQAALRSVREAGARKIVLAVPVAAPDSLRRLEKEVDETVCLAAPSFFEAVGAFYRFFEQTSDEEIVHLLSASDRPL
jgi:putative phosphoribosyl transferase